MSRRTRALWQREGAAAASKRRMAHCRGSRPRRVADRAAAMLRCAARARAVSAGRALPEACVWVP
eukprot:6030605-Lingulodinium_polyedra.AAC.1